MSKLLELYGICLFTAILTLVLISRDRRVFPLRLPIFHRTPAAIRRLLAPPTTSKEILLHSRASANARLWRAFRLTNTFVSADLDVHSQFHSQSIALLRASQRDWPQFTRTALLAVELALPNRTTEFHTFVQSVTLSTVIIGLLAPDADITALRANDLEVVSSLITHIWVLSKTPHQIPTQPLQELNERLRRLIPDQDAHPNPLDFVIPAWETLWRVVAVTLAHVHTDPDACEAFRDLNENPGFLQFRAARLFGTSSSVEDYISESLRHFPAPLFGDTHPSPNLH
ncbi:hypothetical protein DFH09DRAFT_1119326 [Mycena vulgaris]|nr:hypothetical protein DFH09DRAFT_1119326 [Mycena vulgaris]